MAVLAAIVYGVLIWLKLLGLVTWSWWWINAPLAVIGAWYCFWVVFWSVVVAIMKRV